MQELGGQSPGHELTGHRGDRGDRRMVSPDGGFIIIIIIAVRVRSPGGIRAGSRSCARARLGWVWEEPGGSRQDTHPGALRAGPGAPQAPPQPGSGMPSKAKSQKAGLRESCCAEGPRCCWGWVGSFRGGRCGRARGGAVGRGSLARGFGSFLLLRVFPTA